MYTFIFAVYQIFDKYQKISQLSRQYYKRIKATKYCLINYDAVQDDEEHHQTDEENPQGDGQYPLDDEELHHCNLEQLQHDDNQSVTKLTQNYYKPNTK